MHADGRQLTEVAALVGDGLLRPVVGEVFAFDRTPQAVQAQTSGGRRGKVVVTGT